VNGLAERIEDATRDRFSFRYPTSDIVHRASWKHGVGGGGRIVADCGRVVWPVSIDDLPFAQSSATFGEPPTCARCIRVEERTSIHKQEES